jgi:hypothetical protein
LRTYSASVMTSKCFYTQEYTGSWYGAVHLAGNSYFFSRFDPLNDAPTSISGHWAGLVSSYASMANIGWNMIHGRGSYGIYCSGGQAYFNNGRIPVGTYTGVHSSASGYVNANGTNAKNWASTKYSPSTNDTLGNNMGSISFN